MAKFYDYITSAGVPPDFAWVDLSIDYNACGNDRHPQLTLNGPLMMVELAIIENIANDPIEVGAFEYRQSSASALRPANSAANDPAQRASWFAPKFLLPGERIVVPTRLLLQFEAEQWDHGNPALPRVNDVTALAPEMLAPLGTTPDAVVSLLANAPPSPGTTFVWGPSITLDSVEIEGVAYEVRSAATRTDLVSSGNPIGSCPYFAGYSTVAGKWLSGGTILRGRNSAARAGTERRDLPAFDGRVVLEEREHEETFIDALAVEVTTADGRIHHLAPETKLPLRLTFGERVMVRFHPMPGGRVTRATLIASGYFIETGSSLHRR